MDEAAWERRLALLWASLDEQHEDDFLAAMDALVAERPPDDPVGLYEQASAFDSTGHPDRAVERYRQALERGLPEGRRRRAVILRPTRGTWTRVAAMSTPQAATVVTGVDFVSVPTRDLERAVAFYGETLGLRRSVYRPERNFAEFETGTVTLSLVNPEAMGIGAFRANANHLALHVEDVAEARATLQERGVTFAGDILDTTVCHMAIFADPDGNALMLHHRYAPRVTEDQ